MILLCLSYAFCFSEVKGTKIRTIGSMGKGSSGLYFPIGVTTNSFGDIIITDTGNHLVKMFDSQGVFVKTIGKQVNSIKIMVFEVQNL